MRSTCNANVGHGITLYTESTSTPVWCKRDCRSRKCVSTLCIPFDSDPRVCVEYGGHVGATSPTCRDVESPAFLAGIIPQRIACEVGRSIGGGKMSDANEHTDALRAALKKAGVRETAASDALTLLQAELQDVQVDDETGAVTARYGDSEESQGLEAIAKSFVTERPYLAGETPKDAPEVSPESMTIAEHFESAGAPPTTEPETEAKLLTRDEMDGMSPNELWDAAG